MEPIRIASGISAAVLFAAAGFCLLLAEEADGQAPAAAKVIKKAVEDKPATKKEAQKADAKEAKQKAEKTEKNRSTVLGKLGTAGKHQAKSSSIENPLGRIIRSIFGGNNAGRTERAVARPAEPDVKTEKSAGKGDPRARDSVDLLAPYSPDQGRLIRRAETMIQEKNWEQARPLLQYLVDPRDRRGGQLPLNDSLLRTENERWVSVIDEAGRMLLQFPDDELQRLRLQYGGEARSELAEARNRGDVAALAEIATRYPYTDAAEQAANLVAAYHFDRREFGMAARWFRRLQERGAEVTRSPGWQLKAAYAFRQAGQTSSGEKLVAQLAARTGEIELGTGRINPKDWYEKQPEVSFPDPPLLEEWPMYLGSPGRTGTVAGGEPLLLRRWSVPLTHRRVLSERITMLENDLSDQKRALIPAMHPLMVDGKAVFRTLRGVQVVDAASGTLLWETREGISAERLLMGEKPPQPQYGDETIMVFGGGFAQVQSTYSSAGGGDQQPLASLLYRDGVHGMITSDGQRLYVIEDHALLPTASNNNYRMAWGVGGGGGRSDPYRRDWASNRIAAYKLDNGRALWTAGGAKMNEPFDPELAGTCFFGAPVPDGGELFVVGERDGEIRLYSLNSENGLMNWSQLVAYADTRIDREYGRRLWAAPVGIRDGVVVCPTTVGWLVAVDRLSHSVLWAHRYTRPDRSSENRRRRRVNPFGSSRGPEQVQPGELNSRWSPSAPVVSGHRVIFTPSEDASLHCVNLYDGSEIWKKPKGSYLYLAGVFGERVVLAGKTAVTALSIRDGSQVWSRTIPSADGPPSGCGIAAEGRYLLPLGSGQLWSIDLETGGVENKFYLADDRQPLGNLAMYRRTLFSLTPAAMTSFEERETITREIARRKQTDPQDGWALLREADMAMLKRAYPEALSRLKAIKPGKLDAALKPRFRRAMVESLAAVIRSDPAETPPTHGRELAELKAFAESDSERLLAARLQAERLVAQNELASAFEAYRELAGEFGGKIDLTLSRVDDREITIGVIPWAAGKLRDLWPQIPPVEQQRLAGRIEAAAGAALSGTPEDQQRFARLFAFHPASIAVVQHLADAHAAAGAVSRAELLLLDLTRRPEKPQQAVAYDRLSVLMSRHGLSRDAAFYDEILQKRFAEAILPDGRAVKEILRGRNNRAGQNTADSTEGPWGRFDLQISRTGTSGYSSSMRSTGLSGARSELPYFGSHRLTLSNQRLSVVDTDKDALHWMVALRSANGGTQSNFTAVKSRGHALFLVHRDVLHCLSLVDRQVLWTRPVDTRLRAGAFYRHQNRRTPQPLQNGTAILSQQKLQARASTEGMLAAVAGDYACVYGRRRFTMLDAHTGEVRFTRDGIQRGTHVFGSDDVIYVVTPDRGESFALRASDGKKLEIANVGELFEKVIRIIGNSLVLVESDRSSLFGFTRRETILRRFNPLTGKEDWKMEFPNGTYFSLLGDGHLVALPQSSQLQIVDLDDGRKKDLGTPEDLGRLKTRNNVYALADRDHVYLAVNTSRSRRSYWGGGDLSAIHLSGELLAFSRTTGELKWKMPVPGQQMIFQQLNASPVLLFSTRSYENISGAGGYWKMKLLAIDKHSGRRVLDSTVPNVHGFQSMEVNIARRNIELRTYNELVRLQAVEKQADRGGGK